MDRGAWWGTVHGVARVRHDLATKPPPLCQSSQWCHPTISSSVICFSSCLQSFPASGSFFPNEPILRHRWPKYCGFSFNISPSNEYSVFISFRIDWFDLLVAQETFKSLLQHHNLKALSLLYGPTLTSMHEYWKNHRFNYVNFCQQHDG